MMQRIPVTLLTGFLGSGKTTLLNYLVQQPELADALILINEFGEIGLDHLLVEHSDENIVVEMSSGCLCCTIRGDLVDALTDIHARYQHGDKPCFTRVVIETTGLADPAPIVHTLSTHLDLMERYRLDGMVATVDARNGNSTLDEHEEAVKQAAMADRLLLTKTDLVDDDVVISLTGRLRAINPAAHVIPVEHGRLAVGEILNLGLFSPDGKIDDVSRWLAEERYAEHGHSHEHGRAGHHEHHDHAHDINRHDDGIRAFCFTIPEPISVRLFTEWLDVLLSLMGPSMLRIKGILNIQNEPQPIVVHGVQHVFHPPVKLERWPTDDRRSKLLFITRSVGRETIEETFRLFREVEGLHEERAV